MNKLGFFTPIIFKNPSLKEWLIEKADNCFYFGGRRAQLIKNSKDDVISVNGKVSCLSIAVKVAAICTILIPLIALTIKTIARCSRKFHFLEEDKKISSLISPIKVKPEQLNPSESILTTLEPIQSLLKNQTTRNENDKKIKAVDKIRPLIDSHQINQAAQVNQGIVTENLVCAITQEAFKRPWILLEDGFTYELDAIQEWLQSHPNNSPMIREIPFATLVPNCAIANLESTCPITGKPFEEPYYCLEDGHTYERQAFLDWLESEIQKKVEERKEEVKNLATEWIPTQFISPAGWPIKSVTLYPNKILYKTNIPQNQEPICRKIDIDKRIFDQMSNQEISIINDAEARHLISQYANPSDQKNEKDVLLQKLNERRLQLGLKNSEHSRHFIELSHLDISGTIFKNINFFFIPLIQANVSNCMFINCKFKHNQILQCNAKNAIFINCTFDGDMFFYKTDMLNTVMQDCKLGLEKAIGEVWNTFTQMLMDRGALNVDTIKSSLLRAGIC